MVFVWTIIVVHDTRLKVGERATVKLIDRKLSDNVMTNREKEKTDK